ncbi:MAG: hypothetical protein V1734_04805 [Nanoarchaeota archaeon]
MKMPETFFSSFIAKKPSVIINSMLHMEGNGNDFIEHCGKRINLEGICSMALFEKAFLEKQERSVADKAKADKLSSAISVLEAKQSKERIRLAELVMSGKAPKSNNLLLGSVLPSKSLFIYSNQAYPLFECGNNACINGRNYSLGLSPLSSLKEIEEKYIKTASNSCCNSETKLNCLEALASGHYYDDKKNTGFKIINDKFVVFTKIKPYVLYESLNNSYYRFPEAVIGAPLFMRNNCLDFGKLYVLNAYSHPALPSFDAELQMICTGKYDYNAIKRIHKQPKEQIEGLMEKARGVLCNEYRSRGTPYYFLTNSRFDRQRITGSVNKEKVTNLG